MVPNGRDRLTCATTRRASTKRWAERNREQQLEAQRKCRRRLYASRKEAGVCTNCGGPLLSEALCWGCLNRQEDARGIRV